MNINYEIIYFFKIGLDFNLIEKDSIIGWADKLIENENVDDNFLVIDLSLAKYTSKISVILNLAIEQYHELPNFEKIGKSLIGFISKKLHKRQLILTLLRMRIIKFNYIF